MSGDEFTEALMKATAALAELQPTNATEAMLGAQRVGTQRAVMVFLYDAMRPGQQVEVVDRHVNRAARLMRVFNEQVETMARLKGKGGQQRVTSSTSPSRPADRRSSAPFYRGEGERVARIADEP